MANHDMDDQDGRDQPSRPYLLIPYWDPGDRGPNDPGDRGDLRPVPADIIPYLCEGISTAAPYQPGQPLTVHVDVRNCGGGVAGSIALVRVWWEFPASAFVAMSPTRLIGVSSVVIPPRGATNRSGAMTHTFSSMPPAHICLVACVDHPADPAPRKSDPQQSLNPLPALERHWAQHNLSYVAPDPGGMFNFPFLIGNPFRQEAEFTVEVQSLARNKLERLVRILRAEPVNIQGRGALFATRDLHDLRSDRQGERAYSMVLAGGTQTSMHLRMQLSRVPSEGEFAAFEVVQRRRGEDQSVGGIVLIVTAPGRSQR